MTTAATIILTASAIVIENAPNMVELAFKIRKLLREEGLEANVAQVNVQARNAADATLDLITEWEKKQTGA